MNIDIQLQAIAPELRGKAREQVLSILEEHKELMGRGDHDLGKFEYSQSQRFYSQVLRILLSGGEYDPSEQPIFHTNLEHKIRRLMRLYEPKNASKAAYVIPVYDTSKAHRPSQKYKRQKHLTDMQHNILKEMRMEVIEKINFLKKRQSMKNQRSYPRALVR